MAKRRLINIDDSAFEKAHLLRVEKYAQQVDEIYNSAINEYVKLGLSIKNLNAEKVFSFNDYPETSDRLNKILKDTSSKITGTVRSGIKDEWNFAGTKNDKLVESILGKSKLNKKQLEKYSSRNIDALAAFQDRKDGKDNLGLSKRIWSYVKGHKDEIELGLDIGIGEGMPAAEIASLLKKNLQSPDNLFRRVKNKKGVLIPSKTAQKFNPGAGVYRSSYKNALRVARTETNMAYRASDHERWMQLDFVVGIEIKLSNNPNHCPLCEALAGKYPKEFKFVGWHPQCRCHAISILKTAQEIDDEELQLLNGETPSGSSKNKVDDVPARFKEWLETNKDRIKTAKNIPFWINDNFKGGDITKGLNFKTKSAKGKTVKLSKAKSYEAAKNIVENWSAYKESLTHITEQIYSMHPELSKFEKEVLFSYTDKMYMPVNSYLNGFVKNVEDNGIKEKAYEKLLNSSLDNLDSKFEGVVFRGLFMNSKQVQAMEKIRKQGGAWVNKGFMSTSNQAGSEFSGNVKMMILSKSGKSISGLSKYGLSESEVLFKSHTKFKIIEITSDGSVHYIRLAEID